METKKLISENSIPDTDMEQAKDSKAAKRQNLLLWVIVLLIILLVGVSIAFAVYATTETKAKKPKNFILMISDGFGPASETMARNYVQTQTSGLPVNYTLALDDILVGSSRTRSSSSLVTDSASGATAYSCGIKTYNAAIAVDDDFNVCGTLLEAAQLKGMRTGLVATSRITHATPASFSSHVVDRDMENEIAPQQIEHLVDVMFGGGMRHFLPQSENGSHREDDRDLIKEAKDAGYRFISTKTELNSVANDAKLPILGLFAMADIPYQIDYANSGAPSLLEIASKAIQLLHSATKDSDKGFFLLIEGSRIDHAAHSNDAASHLREILMYQEVVAYVRQFIVENPDTMMVSVSDHETGGLTIARQLTSDYPEYLWHPQYLTPVKNSTEVIIPTIYAAADVGEEYLDEYLDVVFTEYYGLDDVTEEERNNIKFWISSDDPNAYYELESSLVDLINVRAQLGWTTHGHSAVDVNLYSDGEQASVFRGNNENTEVGLKIANLMELDLKAATDKYSKLYGNRVDIKEEDTNDNNARMADSERFSGADHFHRHAKHIPRNQ